MSRLRRLHRLGESRPWRPRQKHGWSNTPLITQQTTVSGDAYKTLLSSSLKPVNSLQDVKKKGVSTPPELALDTTVKLLELQQSDHLEHWLTFHNFNVITRYNHSHLYAMAVYQLSQEIKHGFQVASK